MLPTEEIKLKTCYLWISLQDNPSLKYNTSPFFIFRTTYQEQIAYRLQASVHLGDSKYIYIQLPLTGYYTTLFLSVQVKGDNSRSSMTKKQFGSLSHLVAQRQNPLLCTVRKRICSYLLFEKYAIAVIYLTVWVLKTHSGISNQLLKNTAWNFRDTGNTDKTQTKKT